MKKKPTKKPKKKVKENTLVLFPTVQLERIAKALESIDLSLKGKALMNELVEAQEELESLSETKGNKVRPINTVENIAKHFDWVYRWITPENCPLKPVNNIEKEVELIKFDKYISTDDAIKEMAAQGYVPAPSNYLLGLGVQYPEIHKEYKYIVSLDKQNLFAGQDGDPCFLCLYWCDGRRLGVVREAYDWSVRWWFLVIKK